MIRIENLTKIYGDKKAVNSVTLEVFKNELFVLLGESGSGKTTTLKMINRLIEPDSGKISLNGKDVLKSNADELRRGIGFVMQNHGLFPHYTILENISVVPQLLKWQSGKIKKRAEELLEIFGLPVRQVISQFPSQLSGGQQQRIGMIRALMASPPIILMDEPLGALDPVTRLSIRKEFKSLDELKDKTIVMVTHDVQEAIELGDRIGVMHQGKLVQYGKANDLLNQPANSIIADFFKDQRFFLLMKSTPIHSMFPDLLALNHQHDPLLSINSRTSVFEVLEVFSAHSQKSLHFISNTKNADQKNIRNAADVMTAFLNFQAKAPQTPPIS